MSDVLELSESERKVTRAARSKALILYKGEEVPHHSCGIAVAATFSLPTRPYQALRRGGITGCGQCGAIRGGEQVLGELLGDPDPAGPTTDALRAAVTWYQSEVERRIDKGTSADYICNNMTGQFAEFRSPERHQFCTGVTAQVAELTAEALVRFGKRDVPLTIQPIDYPGRAAGSGQKLAEDVEETP